MIGLRGVGKTVLLERTRQQAEDDGLRTVSVESLENRSLPAVLAPALRQALLAMSTIERAQDAARRGLQALAGFVGALRVNYGECLFVDELQYVEEDELSALMTALHRAAQRQSPVVLIGAGLPQLRARAGRAKSYAERLFAFAEIGPLSPEAARQAIERPAQAAGVTFGDAALQRIVETTQGYPYFLQEWASHAWNEAEASPIDLGDVERASETATAALDDSFFRVRFDRLTETERRYLRAMAELGPGPHRSGAIAAVLGRQVKSLGPTRSQLISKGMVWSPRHGETAFTVPLFDQFMLRAMEDNWQ